MITDNLTTAFFVTSCDKTDELALHDIADEYGAEELELMFSFNIDEEDY